MLPSRRWKQLLHDVPDTTLDLKLDDVKARLFPGFECWLLRRLRGPLVRDNTTMQR